MHCLDFFVLFFQRRSPGSAIMTTKVKGLLRGLRYISQIFDEKEQEMQIGFPTDMNEFNSPPELPCGTSNSKEEVKSLSTDPHPEDTIQTEKPKHRSRRSSGSGSSLLNSPDRRSGADHLGIPGTKHPAVRSSRRHRSSNKSMDSPKGESSSGTSRISRRQRTRVLMRIATHDQPSIPKHSRGRKSRGSPGSGPSKSKEKKSSKEAAPFSDPGSGAVNL
ncbi:ROP-INTERACTIVE CRIB MOTIF-CONTAINING protein [Salix suchowensis]|nr:ROP-INTERACTIVE CRIB MOTIF-CONTAINING protein [Salix suchowensis]